MRLILGSSSKGRRAILERRGYDFEIIKPEIDEQAIRCDDPRELVLKIAHAKADEIEGQVDGDAIIIASDQVVVCDGQIREKPKDKQEARSFILSYHKHPAEIINGMVLIDTSDGERADGLDISKTLLKEQLPDEVVDQIIKKGHVLHCAGGIQLEDPLIKPYIKYSEATEDQLRGMPLRLFQKLLAELV